MKINSELVKRLRNDRHWSQQQLSDACGLNLRTVQRLEATGKASIESIRALASVFEVSADELIIAETDEPPVAMTLFTAAKYCLSNYANFEGKASRPEYWWFFLFVLLIAAVSKILHEQLYLLVGVLILVPLLAAGARRLNDSGYSGWWQLLFLVPFGFVPIFFMLAMESVEENEELAS